MSSSGRMVRLGGWGDWEDWGGWGVVTGTGVAVSDSPKIGVATSVAACMHRA